MELTSYLLGSSGMARTASLRAAGFGKHEIATAVRTGTVFHPLRGWVALPETDALLLRAAKGRAVVTCVTQAERLGLWVFGQVLPHFGLLEQHARRPEGCVAHWGRPLVPRLPGAVVDPVENVLGMVASCQPFESALVVWESALNKQLVDYERLSALPLRGAAKDLLEVSTPFSDSGLESLVCKRLRWLRVPVRPQAWAHGRRVDFLIGERLVLQIDGATHTGQQRTSDIEHDAELMLRGYTIIRVSYEQVVHRWPEVQDRIMGAIARGKHLATSLRVGR